MSTIECDLIIVGAAVAGGSLAAALRDSGLEVVILDTAPGIPEVNRGDHLAPPVVRYLDSIGVLEHFLERGASKVTKWEAFGPEGEQLAEADLLDFLEPPYNYILGLEHPKIQASFMASIEDRPNFRVIRGARANGLIRDEGGTVIGVTANRGDEDLEIRAKIVAGCDGVRSVIRKEAGIEADIEWQDEYPMITATRHPDQGLHVNWEIWSSEGFVGMYPITAELVRCPVQAHRKEMRRWREVGFETVKKELAEKYPLFQKMDIKTDQLHVYRTSKHNNPTYVADGVLLSGEAAHTTPPFYGFGMAMAIRDSREAAKQIIECIQSGDVSAPALKPYEERVVEYNLFAINANTMYREVATSGITDAEELQQVLKEKPALDPAIMGRLYGDWAS